MKGIKPGLASVKTHHTVETRSDLTLVRRARVLGSAVSERRCAEFPALRPGRASSPAGELVFVAATSAGACRGFGAGDTAGTAAGLVAARSAHQSPLLQGAAAGLLAVVAWIPIRVVVWAVRENGRGLVSGDRAALPLGDVLGALALGLVVGLLLMPLLSLRIGIEERMLRAELEGYADYAERVRWPMICLVFSW